MDKEIYSKITLPTLLLDESKAKKNLEKLAAKAAAQSICLRPHYKTHQSAEIGEWFREVGIRCITVSSVQMACYFADHGWEDITIAFPLNIRQMGEVVRLADEIELGILLESIEIAEKLEQALNSIVNIWIKIDTGLHRAGIWWEYSDQIYHLADFINRSHFLKLKGLLTHAGQTYNASSVKEIRQLYSHSNAIMNHLRDALQELGIKGVELSVGDTPGCWLSEDLGAVDEIRPGNFLFFDAMMMDLGVCSAEEIAVAVACPVVARYPDRGEVIIYGGAVHLSKQMIQHENQSVYGYVAMPEMDGWRFLGKENYVRALSQEHGILKMEQVHLSGVEIGDLLYILPVHSCLAVDVLGKYLTLEGKQIETMKSC